jgi:hypothetical protein
LIVWDFSPFFIPLLLVFLLFLLPTLLSPIVQLFWEITIIAWTGSRVSHGVGGWWRFPEVYVSVG